MEECGCGRGWNGDKFENGDTTASYLHNGVGLRQVNEEQREYLSAAHTDQGKHLVR